ncbi:unnamed protein product [Protopolystoma xenopodis]|uniref:SET domain-containing protein n=1 Tax=Protopolystoma xenopodis TaxID=117903 RepID=A0A3S4ZBH7_9PLAT|nr:unnamed protein product [Protopolystoma xenopodis]
MPLCHSYISHPIVPVKRRGRDKKLRRSYSTSAMMNTRPTIDKPAKSCISSPKKSGVEIPLAVQPQKRQILRKDVSRATNKQTELTVSARQTKLTSLGVQRTANNSSKDCIEDLPKLNESGFSTDISGPLEQVASPRTKLQTKLTSLGIRRTARQFLKELARERESDYLRSLRDNIETGMRVGFECYGLSSFRFMLFLSYVIMTEEKGRGVVASRLFIQDEFVVEYAGELISEREGHAREKEYKQNPELGSYMFFFVHA